MTDAARLKATVYVGGLDNAVNDRILIDAFLPFGDIVEVSLPKPEAPSSPDPHRGFGYVEFEVVQDAKEAIDNMDQSELFGRVIKVAPAKPQKDSNEGLGSKRAIWEQVISSDRFHILLVRGCRMILIRVLVGRLAGKTCCERRRQAGNGKR